MKNKKELKILSYLRENSRISLAELSKKSSIPVTTIYDAIERLTRNKVLLSYPTILKFEEIGFNSRVLLTIKSKNKKNLMDFLTKHPNVNTLSKIYGSRDLIADIVFSDVTKYESFKEYIIKFAEIEEYLITDCLKAELAEIF